MADNRKSTITAKVAEQIVEYYQMALKALDMGNASNVLGSRQLKVSTIRWPSKPSTWATLATFLGADNLRLVSSSMLVY